MKVYANEIDGKIDRVEDYVRVQKIPKKTKAYVKSTESIDVHFFDVLNKHIGTTTKTNQNKTQKRQQSTKLLMLLRILSWNQYIREHSDLLLLLMVLSLPS
jgi:hypothetical protein